MKRGRILLLGCLALVVIGAIYGAALIRRGFAASEEPSGLEKLMARAVRNLSIPGRARKETNPWKPTPENLQEGRDHFLARCAICHGTDGSGVTPVGRNLYPKPPDLRAPETQDLTDGQIHYIIQKGVRLTGMPAWGNPHDEADKEGWKLLLFIRSLRPLSGREQSQEEATARTAHYTGSQACAKCHHEIYDRWKETPMAKVVRDPREHPDAILASSPNSLRTRSRWFMGASGSSGTLRELAMTIIRSRPSGTSPIMSGARTLLRREPIGGSRFIRRTICSALPVLPATAAIRWITTFGQAK